MKKNIILTIILSLLLVAGTSAQIKSPKTENSLTTEQKMLPFAMGMSLSVLGGMHDENSLDALKIFQKQIRYWSEELKPVVEMNKDIAEYKRLDIVITATKALRDKSTPSDKWQMLIGEYFGNIYVQIKKNKTENREINVEDLKFDIEMIGILAEKAPSDIPWNVTAKFKEFGKMKDAENLSSDKNINKLTEEVVNILSTISK